MRTADIVWEHVQRERLCPGAESLASWLDARWLRVFFRGRAVPVFPSWGFKNDLVLHDIHHLLTGCDISLAGEFELAAWELASGGCAWNPVMWVDRLFVLLLGLFLAPRRIVKGARRGRGCTNLFGRRRAEVLAMDFEDVERLVGLSLPR